MKASIQQYLHEQDLIRQTNKEQEHQKEAETLLDLEKKFVRLYTDETHAPLKEHFVLILSLVRSAQYFHKQGEAGSHTLGYTLQCIHDEVDIAIATKEGNLKGLT